MPPKLVRVESQVEMDGSGGLRDGVQVVVRRRACNCGLWDWR